LKAGIISINLECSSNWVSSQPRVKGSYKQKAVGAVHSSALANFLLTSPIYLYAKV
jgi:uncharacterized membrane protein (Fun14 family)